MHQAFEFGWRRESNTELSGVTLVTSRIHICELTSSPMSDSERDARSGDQWISSVVAYLNFNAGTAWRKIHLSGERFNETRWYFLSAANLLNQLRDKTVPQCSCSRCFVGRKPVSRETLKAKAVSA